MNTIENVINTYFQAYMQADSEKIQEAFHLETRLYSIDEGKLDKTEMKDWIANLRQRKERGDVRNGKPEIVSIDSTSDAAIAKIKILLPTMEFTDYLSFLRIADTWTIVGKIYSVKN